MKLRIWAMAAAVAALSASAPALAQDEGDAGAGWQVVCAPVEDGGPEVCRMHQELVQPETGQVAMAITLFYVGEPAQAAVVFALPLGIFLPTGAAYSVDQGEEVPFQLQTCDGNACMATVPLTDEQVAEMRGGQEISVLFKTVDLQTLGLTFALEGFAQALDQIAPS